MTSLLIGQWFYDMGTIFKYLESSDYVNYLILPTYSALRCNFRCGLRQHHCSHKFHICSKRSNTTQGWRSGHQRRYENRKIIWTGAWRQVQTSNIQEPRYPLQDEWRADEKVFYIFVGFFHWNINILAVYAEDSRKHQRKVPFGNLLETGTVAVTPSPVDVLSLLDTCRGCVSACDLIHKVVYVHFVIVDLHECAQRVQWPTFWDCFSV